MSNMFPSQSIRQAKLEVFKCNTELYFVIYHRISRHPWQASAGPEMKTPWLHFSCRKVFTGFIRASSLLILILFQVTLWNFSSKFALQLDGSATSPFLPSSLPLSLLSSHSPCLIRSVINPHSGWWLLIWQRYCLPVCGCCLYCLLSHLMNSSKEKEKGMGENSCKSCSFKQLTV